MYPPDAPVCACGGQLSPSIVPYVLAGKFQFDRQLGRGGMGVVYRALDLDLGRYVAIKTLPHIGPEGASRLRREAKAMAAVQHENLAVIFGAETWLGTPMLVVELLSGGTLAAILRSGPLQCRRTLDIGISVAHGVEHLHDSGVLHCDIKPSNIGFTLKDVPKLLDFGLARILWEGLSGGDTPTPTGSVVDRLALTTLQRVSESARSGTPLYMSPKAIGGQSSTTAAFAGTPLYMSPEAIGGQSPTTAFDVWSLTVVLFEAIAGTPPFRGASIAEITDAVVLGELPDLRKICATCPPSVAEFFERALSRRIGDRPPTAADLRATLTLLRAGLSPG
jgi:serine/threonine-protein kinase